MLHIRKKSIGEVQNTCQKVELSGKIKVLLSELPLTSKERDRLLDYTKSFLLSWMRVLQCSIDVSIVVGGFLLVSHLMKRKWKEKTHQTLVTYKLLNSACKTT